MKNKITLLNMTSGLVLQFFTLISGFIIPKIILTFFGSEVNGLISSLNQFLSYIGLLEGGITGVIIANLYEPIVNHDNEMLSSVLVTANKFFKKIGLIFICYAVILSFLYPLLFKTKFSFSYVYSLTIVLALTLVIQYMFSLTLKTVLEADKKSYIINFTQCIIVVCNIILTLISVFIYPSVHILKLISGSLFILQPIVYGYFVKRNYDINWNAYPDNSLIASRWNGFAINFAAFIHNSTDITILTVFMDLKTVSIYSVYCLVSNGIKQLINACLSGVSHTVGQAYARKNWDELNLKLDIYEYTVFLLVSFLFSVTALLITPFVLLYTRDVIDTDYNQPLFGILLIISEVLYLVKFPHLNLAYSANKFKEITIPAYIEAFLNIVVSIVLVKKFGLIGVALGTIVGMTYRMVFHVYYTRTLIPNRSQIIFYKKLAIFFLSTFVGSCACVLLLPLQTLTIRAWILHAIVYCILIGSILLGVSLIWFKKELIFFKNYIRRA